MRRHRDVLHRVRWKLPGFAPSGPSALDGVKALSRRSRSAEVGRGSSAEPLLPSETKSFWIQLERSVCR
jgi:hypothetical protein